MTTLALRAALAGAALMLTASAGHAQGVLRIGLTASDVPRTTGQADDGGAGMRATAYDGPIDRDPSPAAKASDRVSGARAEGGDRQMAVDDAGVKAEVEAAFQTYEAALVSNDVPVLEALFRDDSRTIRYGAGENLYGMDAIRAFRRGRSSVGLERTLSETVITTYGRDFATAMTLFSRKSAPGRIGRQSQTWVRFPDGWRVVAAHVSLINE